MFVLGERLQGPGVTVTQAHRAIAGAVAAMEIVDSRIEDWRIKLADTVADLASNGAMATSSRLVPLDGLDTRLIGMTLHPQRRAGRHRRRCGGAGRPGGRRRLAGQRARRGSGVALEPGHLIMTGALHAAVPMTAGRRVPRRVRPARPDHDPGGGGDDLMAPRTSHRPRRPPDEGRRRAHRDRPALRRRPGPRPRRPGYAVQRVLRERRGPAGRLEARRHEPGQAGAGRRDQPGLRVPRRRRRPRPRRAARHLGSSSSRAASPRSSSCSDATWPGRTSRRPTCSRRSSGVAVGIEVLDSRYRDYRFTMADVVADNTSAGRFVVGTPVPAGRHRPAAGRRGAGEERRAGGHGVGGGFARPPGRGGGLDGPRDWPSTARGCAAGEVVLSGGLTAAVPVAPGDVVVASIDRLGTLELGCR